MTGTAASYAVPERPHADLSRSYQYASLKDKPRTIRLLEIRHDCGQKDSDSSEEESNSSEEESDSSKEELGWYDQDQREDQRERDRCEEPCCQGFDVDTPRAYLHEMSFDNKIEYEAISYPWGSGDLVERVVCGSGVLKVTRNCYDLLCRLRKRNLDRCTGMKEACNARNGFYWVDALCINQGDQQERSHQVAMMATIYETAAQVIVWPGHVGDEDSVRAGLSTALNSVDRKDITPLRDFIQQAYFTRMWPLQEVALAQRCSILIGEWHRDYNIGWIFLEPLGIGVNTNIGRSYTELVSVRHQYQQVLSLHKRLTSFSHSQSDDTNAIPGQGKHPSISEVLLGARSLQASELRDKVFGLHGVLKRLGASIAAPDYGRSIESVYVEASAGAIVGDSNLGIFEGLTGSSSLDLPSWCPDWSDHQAITKATEWTHHAAGGTIQAAPVVRGRELSTYGLHIDVVCQEHITFAATSLLDEADALINNLVAPINNPRKVPVGQYLDLLQRLFLDVWRSEDDLIFDDNTYRRCLMTMNAEEERRTRLCPLVYQKDDVYVANIRHSYQLYDGLCHRLDRKKIFQTQHGRLGIASEYVKRDDKIVLLQGCNLPMIVRREGDNWKVVAPAYIPEDGIMEGELWKADGPFESFVFI